MAKPQVGEDVEAPFETGDGDFKMPTMEQMLKALDGLQGLSDEDKEELRRSLLERAEIGGDSLKQQIHHAGSGPSLEMITLFTFLSIIILIFVDKQHPSKMEDDLDKVKQVKEKIAGLSDQIEDFAKKIKDMSKEEQEKFFDDVKKQLLGQPDYTNYLIFFGCVLIVLFLFVFFGYKLYKSLVEKERRRDEKRKQKQQKKKK